MKSRLIILNITRYASSVIFWLNALYLVVFNHYGWLAVWVICSVILSVTIKKDLLKVITKLEVSN